MIAKKLLTTIAFAFVLLFSGCAEDDFVGVDGLCPIVESTVPKDKDFDIPLNQVITATFNEKMNPSTITDASFTVSANGALIEGAVSYNGLTATFDPKDALEPDTEYTGTITTMAKDERGNALQENYVWTFTTLPEFLVTVTSNLTFTPGPILTGAGLFVKGTPVTVTAAPYAGYIFTDWTIGGVFASNLPTYTLPPLMGDLNLVANFVAIIQPPVNTGLCDPNAVNLGMARNYAILAKTAITTTGVTSITGNMGISPSGASSIEGFSLIRSVDGTYSNSILVAGRVYASDYTTPTPTNVGTAVGDMGTAYTTANLMAPNFTEHLDGDFNNVRLDPGVYKFGTGLNLTNTITLDGGGTDCAVFIFNIAGSLTVNPNTKIVLTGGARADNIYWVVAGAGATLNTDVDFSGTILAEKLISLAQRTVVNGRLLSQTAVTLIGNTVVMPSN